MVPKYRVTVRTSSVEIVDAANPFMAAVAAVERYTDGAEVADVRPATGRARATAAKKSATKKRAGKKATGAVKKRRPMSPETRAKLAQNLAKARAARAKNLKAAKQTAKRRTRKG